MKLYIMRHGETVWNSLRKLQGTADIPLNENGIRLAEITGKALAEVPFDFAVSSPLSRAVETARLVLKGREIPIYTDERIRKIDFGEMEGSSIEDGMKGAYGENYKRFFQMPFAFQAPKGGESIWDICARTKEFWDELIRIPEYQEKTILITAHGCAVRALLQTAYGETGDFWHGKVPPNCSVNILEVKDQKAVFLEEDKTYY